MLNLLDSVRSQCADIDPALVEMHFRRLPTTYFERYSAAEIARHLRLLAALQGAQLVDVEIYPLASQTFELVVVGMDHPGTLACITGALAAYGFDLDDVQVSPYLDQGSGPQSEPRAAPQRGSQFEPGNGEAGDHGNVCSTRTRVPLQVGTRPEEERRWTR